MLHIPAIPCDIFGAHRPFQLYQHGELARDNVAPHHSFGLDTALPDNLKYIEPGKVMYAAGNTLVILEVATMKRRVIFGLDGGGIGSFAVHPTRTLVAVGEKGSSPNIYIYEYPSFKIAKVSYDVYCKIIAVFPVTRIHTHQRVEFQKVGRPSFHVYHYGILDHTYSLWYDSGQSRHLLEILPKQYLHDRKSCDYTDAVC